MSQRIIIPKERVYFGLAEGGDCDPNWVSEELMLAQLLMDQVVFVNDVHWCFNFYEAKEQIETEKYSGPRFQLKEGVDPKDDTVCCYVNLNDMFCYGADGINVTTKELRSLYEYHMDFEDKYKGYGIAIWASIKQGIPPYHHNFREGMKEAGVWHFVEHLEEIKTNE